MNPQIDYKALADAVREKRAAEGLTMSAAAQAVGVSKSTISRIEGGYRLQLTWGETFAKLCAWLNVSGERFKRESGEVSTLDKIERALNSDPALNESSALTLSGLMRRAYQAVVKQ